MKEKYILAIDGGTQSTKVLIFDLKGHIVSEGKQVLQPTQAPEVGFVEHPGDDLWDSLLVACKQALDGFKGNLSDIIGVGLCTIRCCRVFLRKDGSLAYPVIDWMDPRAYGPFVFPAEDIAYATTTTGYMTHRLTGKFRDTVANCTNRQWPTDMVTWQWSADDGEFDAFNLRRDQMMELCPPGSILGTITEEAAVATGIPVGLPVVATASDKAVEGLGTGLSQGGDTGLVSLGTYITSMVCGSDYQPANEGYWTNFASMPDKYLYESYGIRRGMWTVSWFKSLFGEELAAKASALGVSPETLLERDAAAVPAGSEGLLTVMEWLSTKDKPYKKGIMLGFDVRHNRGHMYRSILEGIAMTMKNNFDAMCNALGMRPGKMIISGGGSNGDLFMQIFADVFGVPTLRNEVNGAAAVGAAICAAVATGAYDSYEEATANMVSVRDEFAPNIDHHRVYEQINREVYKDITSITDGVLKKLYAVMGE